MAIPNAAEKQASRPKYDPNFTDQVIAATGPNADPRLAQIMPSLLRHLHDFAREVDLTVAEWTAGVDLINKAGQMSDDKRNETQLVCDVLGLESLVDEISSKQLHQHHPGPNIATPAAILGPFYRQNAPELPNGSSIIQPSAKPTPWYETAKPHLAHLSGRVYEASSNRAKKSIANATIDLWQAGPNGMYEQQDDTQPDMNLRGRFTTDAQGRWSCYCLRPTSYPIPYDGPAGHLLQLLDRHPYRPAHIHFVVTAAGYRGLTTQIFDGEDPYVADDAVFAVKKELLVRFVPREGDPEGAPWSLEYDISLSRCDEGGEDGGAGL